MGAPEAAGIATGAGIDIGAGVAGAGAPKAARAIAKIASAPPAAAMRRVMKSPL
jgi:hypothetical protein